MTTHLSARLAWHDRGWDGRVCDAPHLNAHCIVHQHIRDARDDDKERSLAGTALSELDGLAPGLARGIRLPMPNADSSSSIGIHLSFVDFPRYRKTYLRTRRVRLRIAGCARSSSKRCVRQRI